MSDANNNEIHYLFKHLGYLFEHIGNNLVGIFPTSGHIGAFGSET